MTAKTLHPYETIALERRWFKDESEFEYICGQLGVGPDHVAEIDEISVSIDRVDFEVEEEETVNA